MGFISRAYYFFTPYTDAYERAVGLFFEKLTEHGDQSRTRARLDRLLQRNIAIINLWTEYRYKGYKYLYKSQRKKLYANLQLIAKDFDRFFAHNARPADAVMSDVHRVVPHATFDPQKLVLLRALMDYFSPRRGMYEYRESSSFGRLLRDPSHEKLVGDCNQIVTLYMYLYSRYYDVRDLQIRALPKHVTLHYSGIDIETTSSTFANFTEKQDGKLLPVEEIVSMNLLDTTDSYLSKHEVPAEDFLQAARLAFILSHERDLVERNLKAAYSSVVNVLMKRHNYNHAIRIAEASRDTTLLGIVGHNGAVYEMGRHNYAAALRFAQHAPKRDALIRSIWQAEGVYLYQAQRYHDAIKAFERIDNQTSVRQCYEALFFKEQEKLGSNLTTESIKHHASTIKRMRVYAKKSGNEKLVRYTADLAKHL